MRKNLAFAAVAAACLATPVAAQDGSGDLRVVIRYADLDLSSHAGIVRFDRRIRAAIALACGPTSDADPAGKNRARACRRAASAQVAAQRDHALAAAAAPTRIALGRRD